MKDQKLDTLDKLLDDARTTYRVPPQPAVDAIWQAVEAEVFEPRIRRDTGLRPGSWRVAAMLAAASLVIGVFAGRWSAAPRLGGNTPAPGATAIAATHVNTPNQRATEEVLGGAAMLFAAMRTTDARGAVAGQYTAQATRLLTSTRMLIDSPAATDPRMQNLLLDLELTLAQIARLQTSRGDSELTLINNAVVERDMVPRIRSAVVDLSAGAY